MHFLLHFLVVSELCGGSDDRSGAWKVPRTTLRCANPYENHPQSHLEGTAARPGRRGWEEGWNTQAEWPGWTQQMSR